MQHMIKFTIWHCDMLCVCMPISICEDVLTMQYLKCKSIP
jgi:hypothetical protein